MRGSVVYCLCALTAAPANNLPRRRRGVTSSTDLPGTTGGTQAAPVGLAGSDDGYVARFNAALTRRQQVTYLGGTDVEQLNALAIHPATGDIYVAGTTASNDLPGALGGASEDYATALAIHPGSGEVYIAGHTSSSDLPLTVGGAQLDSFWQNRRYVSGV